MMPEGNVARVNRLEHKSRSHGKLSEESSLNKPSKRSNYNQGGLQSNSKGFPAKQACKRCTRFHNEGNRCPAINWRCFTCNQIGHTAKSSMCKNKIHNIESEESKKNQEEDNDVLELGLLEINKLGESKNSSLKIEVNIEDKSMRMEVDSGACKSVIHLDDYKEKFSNISLEPVHFKLKVVTGENVKIIGQMSVNIKVKNKKYVLPLIVLDSTIRFTPLLGRNWLDIISPYWKELLVKQAELKVDNIRNIRTDRVDQIKKYTTGIKEKFHKTFTDNDSCIKNFKVNIQLKPNVTPLQYQKKQKYKGSSSMAQDVEVPPTCNAANSDNSKSLNSNPTEDNVQGREEESMGTTPLTDDNIITPVSTANTTPKTAVGQTTRYGRIIKPPKKLDL